MECNREEILREYASFCTKQKPEYYNYEETELTFK